MMFVLSFPRATGNSFPHFPAINFRDLEVTLNRLHRVFLKFAQKKKLNLNMLTIQL